MSSPSRRLALTLALLVLLFALAMGFMLRSLHSLQAGMGELRRREEGVVLSLQLASAVRDQYAHQAHTIILGNLSHLGFYTESHAHVLELVARLKERALTAEERQVIERIEEASGDLDRIFRQEIVPALETGDTEAVETHHSEALARVTGMQSQVDQLVNRFEESIAGYEKESRRISSNNFRFVLLTFAAMLLLASGLGVAIARSFARNRDRLVTSEKLAGIGRLAAGVAHEINNPLAVILGYTRLLRRQASPESAPDLDAVASEALRAQEIVQGMLDLARPRAAGTTALELSELCHDLVETLNDSGQLQDARITIEGKAVCLGTPAKLRQVLLNLIRNGLESAGPQGVLRITIHRLGETIELGVEDNGTGLSSEANAQLFEPFTTTKAGGTGLGLAVSRAIIEAHGGTLEVDGAWSREHAGARFLIRLPAPETGAGSEP